MTDTWTPERLDELAEKITQVADQSPIAGTLIDAMIVMFTALSDAGVEDSPEDMDLMALVLLLFVADAQLTVGAHTRPRPVLVHRRSAS